MIKFVGLLGVLNEILSWKFGELLGGPLFITDKLFSINNQDHSSSALLQLQF